MAAGLGISSGIYNNILNKPPGRWVERRTVRVTALCSPFSKPNSLPPLPCSPSLEADYTLGKILGKGAFGVVRLVLEKRTGAAGGRAGGRAQRRACAAA